MKKLIMFRNSIRENNGIKREFRFVDQETFRTVVLIISDDCGSGSEDARLLWHGKKRDHAGREFKKVIDQSISWMPADAMTMKKKDRLHRELMGRIYRFPVRVDYEDEEYDKFIDTEKRDIGRINMCSSLLSKEWKRYK